MLTRSRGDFDEILDGADLIVELIGGIEPARDYVLARDARRQARRHREQAAALPARRGAVGGRARARRAAALRGRRRRRRAGHPRAAGVARGRARRAHPRDRQRHDELHPHRDGAHRRDLRRRRSPRRSGSATPRPIRPTTSPAATPRRRWRSSRGWRSPRRCTSTRCATRASSTSPPTTSSTRASSASALKLIGTAERVDGGISVRVHPAFLYAGHPLARVNGPFNAVTVESDDDHRDHDVGARRRRPADRERRARRRRQRDDPAGLDAGADRARCAIVEDVVSALLPAHGGRRPARRARAGRRGARRCRARRSSRSCRRASGENARLVMVVHPLLESRFCARGRADRPAGLPALPAARDPRDRGGVRLTERRA